MSVSVNKATIEAGVHYGHQTRRWNRRCLSTFLATEMDHIIDLQKQSKCSKELVTSRKRNC